MILEREANKIFRDLMIQLADRIGFEYDKRLNTKYNPPHLIRKTETGRESIGDLFLEFFNGKLMVGCAFQKRINAIDGIWSRYYGQLNVVVADFDTEVLGTVNSNPRLIREYVYEPENKFKWVRMKDRYEAPSTAEGVADLAARLTDNIEKYVLPTFEKFNSVQAVDQEMNSTPERYFESIHLFSGESLLFKKMIVAKLNRNPMYEEICQKMKAFIVTAIEENSNPSRSKYLDTWQKLKTELDLM